MDFIALVKNENIWTPLCDFKIDENEDKYQVNHFIVTSKNEKDILNCCSEAKKNAKENANIDISVCCMEIDEEDLREIESTISSINTNISAIFNNLLELGLCYDEAVEGCVEFFNQIEDYVNFEINNGVAKLIRTSN